MSRFDHVVEADARKTKEELIAELETLRRHPSELARREGRERKESTDQLPETLKQIYRDAPTGLCYFDRNLRYLFINDWLAGINGIPVDDHLGRRISEVLPDVAAGVESQLRHVIATGEPIVGGTVDAETPAHPGLMRSFQHNHFPVKSDDGTVVGVSCIVEDITERKRTQAALAEKSALLETTLESMSHGIAVHDADLRLVAFNQKYVELRGYPPGFIRLGQSYEEVVRFNAERGELGPGDVEELVRQRIEIMRQGKEKRVERTRPDGMVLDMHRNWLPDGSLLTTFTDITERKRAEAALAEKSALLETTLESMSHGIAVHDADLELVAFNQNYLDLVDFPPGFVRLGLSFEEIIRFLAERGDYGPGDAERQVKERLDSARRKKHHRSELVRPNGFTIAVSRRPLPHGGFVTTFTDITERKRAEAALVEKSALLETTLESMSHGISVYDTDLRLVAFNQKFIELRGYPPGFIRVGMGMEEIARFNTERGEYGPGDAEELVRERIEIMRQGKEQRVERILSDDMVLDMHRNWSPDGRLVNTYSDITERKRAEKEARRHQFELSHVLRRATMGELASALAHELNHPLASILNYCRGSAIRMRSRKWSAGDIAGSLEHISEEAERAVRIIRHVADFVRKSGSEESRVSINDIVRSICPLVEAEANEMDTFIQVNLSDPLPQVTVQKIEIEHVVLNLVRNGIESVAGLNGEKREVIIHTSMAGRNTVEVAVSDTGPGVLAEIRNQVFDPFFSTKPNGMGMGLAISRSIVERHGGRLWADPPGDGGATFRFTLPITMTAKQHVA